MTIIIDPQCSGISGNMIIGALVDLGADAGKLKEVMESSARIVGEVEVTFDEINKCGIDTIYCHVKMFDKKGHVHFNEIVDGINGLDLDEDIKKTSINIFKRMAIAESKVHGKSIDEIHFHEVGASDAVADVVGSVWAFHSLGFDSKNVIGLPIAVGGGTVKTSHGTLPVPVPAVLEILKGYNFIGGPVSSELATPTGCAIYAELCSEIKEFIPLVKADNVGYGSGSKDFDHPNILRIIKSSDINESDKIDVIETNIDHLTGEEIGYLFDVLLDAGASDVSVTPIIMKKNRQGSLLKVISKRSNRDKLVELIFKETGSLGIRIAPNIHRGTAKREFIKKAFVIEGEEYEVTFKIGYVNGEIISSRPEYEDLKKIAQKSGLSLRKVREIVR